MNKYQSPESMPGFEKTLIRDEKKLIDNLEGETLDAIREGSAMPLPDFLERSQEAKKAFTEALQQSNELRRSLTKLNRAEKIAFLEVFNNALDKSDAGLLSTFLTYAGGSIAGAGVTMGVVNDTPYSSPLLAAVTVATGLLMILEGINSQLGSYAERDTLRELIRSAVDA